MKRLIRRLRTKTFRVAKYGNDGFAFRRTCDEVYCYRSKLRPYTLVKCEAGAYYDLTHTGAITLLGTLDLNNATVEFGTSGFNWTGRVA